MAFIKISELRPAGSELFQDSESFLNELNSQEMEISRGGFSLISRVSNAGTLGISISAQTVNGNTVNANTYSNANTVVSFG